VDRCRCVSDIVVPLDGSVPSQRALPVARTLGAQLGTHVTLVSAVPPDGVAARRVVLERLAAPDEAVVVCGHEPVDALRETLAVRRAGVRGAGPVLCMATHARAGAASVVLGSVAEAVVRAGLAPVVLVGPHSAVPVARRARLVVCLDGSSVSEAIVPIARSWAHALGVAVHLVAVVDPGVVEGLYVVDGGAPVTERRLEELAAGFTADGLDVTIHVVRAHDAAHAIDGFASALPAPVVALATHGRTGLARVALGSVATAVVRHATYPVLVVRPTDLVPD
jgi:nucleotide-binding universal stress UspA family protein